MSLSKARIGQEIDAAFLDRVDEWVLAALKNQRPSFDRLLPRLPGIFPGEVLASIRRLEEKSLLPKEYRREIEESVRMRRPQARKMADRLLGTEHIDHPLDFEWPFAREAHRAILRTLCDLDGYRAGTVLCLGCPSFFSYAKSAGTSRRFMLWDKNASLAGQMGEVEALSNCDLTKDVFPRVVAQTAVLDPPWYNAFYELFIWASMGSLQIGSKLLLSFPAVGTRPTAEGDLSRLLCWCKQIGAELWAHHPGLLPYRTPLFELNALHAQGIHSVPLDWRRGDLIILEKTRNTETPRPVFPGDSPCWHEYRIGVVRIRIRSGEMDEVASPLRCVARTAILPSVSTRYPGREHANVVTSGNRFFHTSSPLQFESLCQKVSSNWGAPGRRRNPQTGSFAPLSRLRCQLQRILLQETNETIDYLSSTHDL